LVQLRIAPQNPKTPRSNIKVNHWRRLVPI